MQERSCGGERRKARGNAAPFKNGSWCLTLAPPGTVAAPARPVFEVADVVRQFGAGFLERHGAALSAEQRHVLRDLARCRTAALGGHVERCDHCGHERISYNSCRNRHCPKCQGAQRAAWLEREAGCLLPVEYYHVVFTLPEPLGPVALQNPRRVYGLLLQAAAATVKEAAANPRHLGAVPGLVLALHTWGQTLQLHPHVHGIVTGGGLACDAKGRLLPEACWRSCRPGFLLPVGVLKALFRGKFLAGLQAAYRRGELQWHGRLAHLADPDGFAAWLTPLYQSDWVVYIQPCGGAEEVLKYVARYSNRVAISNSRLLDITDDGQVTFQYKDYADHERHKTMTLSSDEFLRRFLQHVLPPRFVKIRHYGLLANRGREERLQSCRQLLRWAGAAAQLETQPPAPAAALVERCPVCGVGHMVPVAELPAGSRGRPGPRLLDSS